MTSIRLIPDWELPKSIGLVWPEKLLDIRIRSLVNTFYINLIELLIEKVTKEVKLTFIHRRGEKERLYSYFGKERIKPIENNNIQDIWIRDFAPFWKKSAECLTAVKGHYYPEYEKESYLKYSKHDDQAGIDLGTPGLESIELSDNRIILDGGNFTHNGNGIGICSNRLITANEHFFIDKLIEQVKHYLAFDKLILIPAEFGDDTGHVDGMVRFVSENNVLVSEYPYEWIKGGDHIEESEYHFARNQLNEISEYLTTLGLKVHRIPNGIPQISDFESAVGNYTNFLRVGEKVFVPQYGIEDQDMAALKVFEKAGFNEKDIVAVP